MDSLIYESGLFIPEPAGDIELRPCHICKRTFVPATLEKHIGICQKMQVRKRPTFDSSQMRREGTELEKYMPPPPVHQSPSSVHKWLDSRVSPPKQTPKPIRKTISPVPNTKQTLGRQGRSNSTSSTGTIGEYVRKRNLSKESPSDVCPYCDRSFGLRAFDRHVEWCKEKAVLKAHGAQQQKDNVGKERLQARINYRAPSLRTKRTNTREKYSPFDDGFMRSFVHNRNKSLSEAGRSLCNSMTSSIISDGGFSDKYDPFMSAKRQLEELFSPSQEVSGPNKSRTVNKPNPSKSITPTYPTRTKPIVSPVTDSNFRRSMSLRLPKKSPIKPMVSSVQAGITDDGPISTNFLKPEQYDEIPVRSVYSTLATNRNLSPVLRDPETIPNRKNSSKIILPSLEFPISKTDSLAAFLNYEKNLGLSDKDLKDSSNILHQQSLKVLSEQDDSEDEEESAKREIDEALDLGSFDEQEALANSHAKTTAGESVDYIDPGLINAYDNLNTTDAGNIAMPLLPGRLSKSNSDRRVQLKRQMKLELDNILYETPQVAETKDDSLLAEHGNGIGNKDTGKRPEEKSNSCEPPIEKYFDDFDFEEFINSFEDDEQNPIFKGYKEMLQGKEEEDESEVEDEKDIFGETNKADSSYGSLTRQSTPEKDHQHKDRHPPVTVKLSRFCYECGNEFVAQAKFCIECGVKRVVLQE